MYMHAPNSVTKPGRLVSENSPAAVVITVQWIKSTAQYVYTHIRTLPNLCIQQLTLAFWTHVNISKTPYSS
jgi:hypothetical protein